MESSVENVESPMPESKKQKEDWKPLFARCLTALHTTSLTLTESYQCCCSVFKVRQNPLVSALFKDITDFGSLEILDLSDTYLGSRSVIALMPILQFASDLEVLDLSGNGIDDATGVILCRLLHSHPKLRTLRLSNNVLGRQSGKYLLRLLRTCHLITDVAVNGNPIAPSVQTAIVSLAKDNRYYVYRQCFRQPWTASNVHEGGVSFQNMRGEVSFSAETLALISAVQRTLWAYTHQMRDVFALFLADECPDGAKGPCSCLSQMPWTQFVQTLPLLGGELSSSLTQPSPQLVTEFAVAMRALGACPPFEWSSPTSTAPEPGGALPTSNDTPAKENEPSEAAPEATQDGVRSPNGEGESASAETSIVLFADVLFRLRPAHATVLRGYDFEFSHNDAATNPVVVSMQTQALLDSIFDHKQLLNIRLREIDILTSGIVTTAELFRVLLNMRFGDAFGFLNPSIKRCAVKELFILLHLDSRLIVEYKEFLALIIPAGKSYFVNFDEVTPAPTAPSAAEVLPTDQADIP